MQKYLIVIAGPTASGKTNLSIELAQKLDCDIIGADSRQFYKKMDIGTAKPTPEQLAKVKHHYIDFLDIENPYSIGDYERDTLLFLDPYFTKKDCIILCGGSGMYIRALCEGLDNYPEVPIEIKDFYQQKLENEGVITLQNELQIADPIYYKKVDIHNPHRLIRALSVIKSSGSTFSSFQLKEKPKRNFEIIYILVQPERQILYENINHRVYDMMLQGLLKEATALFPFRKLNALQTVGYQELFDHLEGKYDLKEAIEKIKQHTRNYAKRQTTWFKKDDHWQVFENADSESILKYIQSKL
jgi:tRNA dimethylallyltransferase